MTDSEKELPLAGVRILDIATFVAAPFASTILSEFGAEVIKVENPQGGDPWRHYGTKTERDGDTLAWMTESRNKTSVTLDTRRSRDIETAGEGLRCNVRKLSSWNFGAVGSWLGCLERGEPRFGNASHFRIRAIRAV